jgi:biopolymer transport protein ExbD
MKDPTTKFAQFSNRSNSGGLNIVPLIDVMFLILAFYVATSLSMVYQTAISVDLASSSSGSKEAGETRPLTVTVKEDGQLFLNKESIQQAALMAALEMVAKSEPNKVLQLNADKNTRHEFVVAALDIVKSSGLKNVTLLVEPKS